MRERVSKSVPYPTIYGHLYITFTLSLTLKISKDGVRHKGLTGKETILGYLQGCTVFHCVPQEKYLSRFEQWRRRYVSEQQAGLIKDVVQVMTIFANASVESVREALHCLLSHCWRYGDTFVSSGLL